MNEHNFENDQKYFSESKTKGVTKINKEGGETKSDIQSDLVKVDDQKYISNKPRRIIIRARIIHD